MGGCAAVIAFNDEFEIKFNLRHKMPSSVASLSSRIAAANRGLADVGGVVWLEHINLVIADKASYSEY